jgi:hypothetical protein
MQEPLLQMESAAVSWVFGGFMAKCFLRPFVTKEYCLNAQNCLYEPSKLEHDLKMQREFDAVVNLTLKELDFTYSV